jgi:hypothetical protein
MSIRSLLFAALLGVSTLAPLMACDAGGQDTKSGDQELIARVNVVTSRYDNARTGTNTQERLLKKANVAAASFGKLYMRNVDGPIYAQPLYVGNVNGKNLVFVATEHNSVFAFDADDMRADAPPIWTKNFGAPVTSADTECGLLGPEVGITSTPVIDPDAGTIWFTTRNKEDGRFLHKLHALDIATGEPRPNSPAIITAEARGTGEAAVNGVIKLDGLRTMQRPGLLKVNGKIFLAFASLCDIRPYHGWVLGYDAATLKQTDVHITTPNGSAGGIWGGGVGLNADDNGDIYYVSADIYGNTQNGVTPSGPFNGEGNLGNSMVRLHDTGSGLQVVTKFSPFDTATVSPTDRSLGNGGGILIPNTNLYLAGDKRGMGFLVDRDAMGDTADQDGQIVQKWQAAPSVTTHGGTHGGGAYYANGIGGTYFMWAIGDRLRAYKFDGSTFELPSLVNQDTLVGFPGGALSVSVDGEREGTAILWAIRGKRTNPGLAATTGAGVLLAFDADDITKQLWSSDDAPKDMLGNASKFNPPTVANGKVYVGTASNQLVVYGLLGGNAPSNGVALGGAASDAPPMAAAPASVRVPTWTEVYDKLLGPNTPGHCGGPGRCHSTERSGFMCGTTKDSCFQGLLDAKLIDPANPPASAIISPVESPLSWFGGGMPLDLDEANPAAAASLTAWVRAGAKKD